MSALNELKGDNTLNIDATGSGTGTNSTKSVATNRMSINPDNSHRKHTVVTNRVPVSAKDISKNLVIDATGASEEKDPNIHNSMEEDILNLDDPNSMLSKYVKETEQEAREWIEAKKEEAEIADLEDEDVEVDDNKAKIRNTDNAVDEEETVDESAIIEDSVDEEDVDTEDLSDLFNDNVVVDGVDGIDDIDLDDEALESLSDEMNKIEDEKETIADSVSNIQKKEKEEKPVQFDAPDIDLDIKDADDGFTEEILDEADEVEDTSSKDTENENLKKMQKMATEKLKPISKELNLKSFTIVKKPIINATPIFKAQKARVAKWVLPESNSVFYMKEFSGSELEKLREYTDDSINIGSLKARFQMIYDHIASAKPASYEAWIKSTPFSDVDHYYFGIYIASFKGANYLPMDCKNDKCKEPFITDNINIMDMVKFDTEKAKKNFSDLYESNETTTNKEGLFATELVPVSPTVAVGFRQPSIGSMLETAALDNATRTKYSSIIDYVPYISGIYYINQEEGTLAPVGYKLYPGNETKTIKSKINKYFNILSTLSIDEFGVIKAYITKLSNDMQNGLSGMHYVYPASTCPKCGATTEEDRMTAEALVFIRYQLGALVNTSLN